MQLSVLDQSPIPKGFTATSALKNTLRLAKETERMGYTRFWLAEHHNTRGLASSSPEVIISHIAANTSKMKIGSGGVLLPQYSPYKVAENFKTLEALYPKRIDLGIGRSPGGSPDTRLALTDGIRKSLNEFPRQLKTLQGFLYDDLPKVHPFHHVDATPISETIPDLWILGISHRGARVAAENGVAFTYGHFINPVNGKRAVEEYFKTYQPTHFNPKPKINVCVFVVCAETEEEAENLCLSQDLWLLNLEKGGNTFLPSVSEAKAYLQNISSEDEKIRRRNRQRMVVGTPEKVKDELEKLKTYYQTEECMVICNIFDIEARLHSYKLLAEAFHLL